MEHLEFAPMNQDVRWPHPEGWPDVSFRQLSCGQWECKVKDGDMIGVGYGDSEVDAWKDAGSPELSRADLTIYPTECEDKFNNVMNFGTLEPMRLPDSWKGLEITHLENGGYYFAPPGDFSKVDFSACQKQEPEQYTYDLTMLHVYGKARIPATKIGELPRIDFEVEGDENGKVQAVTRVWVNGHLQPMSSKPDNSPKTAQHSKQAKPALPSLMTEAGERYRGLGWCDE